MTWHFLYSIQPVTLSQLRFYTGLSIMQGFGNKEYFFFKIIYKKQIESTCMVHAEDNDLALVQKVVMSTGRDAIWTLLSPIDADRQAKMEEVCSDLDPDIHPPATTLTLEEVVVKVVDNSLWKESKVSKTLKGWVHERVNRYYRDNLSSQAQFSPTQGCDQLDRLNRGKGDGEDVEMGGEKDKDCEKEKGTGREKGNGVGETGNNTMAFTKEDLATMFQVVMEGLDKLWRQNERTQETISELQEVVDRVETNQKNLETGISELTIKTGPAQRKMHSCSYCRADDHRHMDCAAKVPCLRCGKDTHQYDACQFSAEMLCRKCRTPGHAALLHQAVDPDFRLKIITEYGNESFSHFWSSENSQNASVAWGVQGRREYGEQPWMGSRGKGLKRLGRGKRN